MGSEPRPQSLGEVWTCEIRTAEPAHRSIAACHVRDLQVDGRSANKALRERPTVRLDTAHPAALPTSISWIVGNAPLQDETCGL